MSRLNKLLLALFVVLLLVIAGEVGYYFFYSNKGAISTNEKSLQICTSLQANDPLNSALLEQLKVINPDIVSSVVQNEFRGKIVELNLQGGRQPIDKVKYKNAKKDFYEYQVGLIIKVGKGEETIEYYWERSVLAKTKLFTKTDKDLQPIEFNDLSLGDNIIIYESIDLMKKGCVSYDCVIEYKIIKI